MDNTENIFAKRKQQLREFNKTLETLKFTQRKDSKVKADIPENLMTKCPSCGKYIPEDEYIAAYKVCPFCGAQTRLHPRERLCSVLDEGYTELFEDVVTEYPDFPGYESKLEKARSESGENESVVCVKGAIKGIPVLVGVMDSYFMMGSMGEVCGERIARLAEKAEKENLPLIIFTCSGGARMQEGIVSLFQMAKTAQAVARLREHGLYISVLTDPTTGGVSASFASLADITLAEPKTLIGFAGKRVIENTIKEVLPPEFQTSEFLLKKGYIDRIVERKDMRDTLDLLLRLHGYKAL